MGPETQLFLLATASSPAPEPAAWALMLAGFFTLGVAMRVSVRRARRQFYLNSGLTPREAAQALGLKGPSLRAHVEEMRRRREGDGSLDPAAGPLFEA